MEKYYEDIKERVNSCYARIKQATEELDNIRKKECMHPETELSNYEWSPGHVAQNVKVCSICGEVVNIYK